MSLADTFDAACRCERTGPGRYERVLDMTYWGHGAQFGGYVQALVLQAMIDEVADAAFAPVSISLHFMRPFGAGEFRCQVEVVRRGRTMANVHLHAWSGDTLAGQAIATFARRRDVGVLLALSPPPELAQPVAVGEMPIDHQMGIPTHALFDMWPRVGSLRERRADGNRVGGWIRMRQPIPLDERVAVMMNDLWPPAVYHLWDVGRVAVSADITTQFRGVFPTNADEPVFLLARTSASQGGFVDEDTEIWSASGELLCQGRQLRFVHD